MCVPVCEKGAGVDSAYRYVYIDTAGQAVFGRYFEYAGNFTGGVAEVTDEDSQVRLINTAGEDLTEGYYSYFDCGSEGDMMPIIGNLVDGGFDLISKTDYSVIAEFRPEEGVYNMSAFHTGDGFIMVNTDSENILLDASGSVLWRGEYTEEMYVSTGYAYTDSQPQRMVVNYITEDGAQSYVTDFALNTLGDAYREVYPVSWIGGIGRYIVANYDLVEREHDDVIYLEPDFESYAYGVIDQEGNAVIPMDYDYLVGLDADRYWAGSGVNYYLLDQDGKVIAEFISE